MLFWTACSHASTHTYLHVQSYVYVYKLCHLAVSDSAAKHKLSLKSIMKLFLFLATVGFIVCQEHYNSSHVELYVTGVEYCRYTQHLREEIRQDVQAFINNSILPGLLTTHELCDCGGPGWRRTAYLNMSDPTQICPPAWELFATPKRSCARPSNATGGSCYSANFTTQESQYTQVCGRIKGYQFGEPGAFFLESTGHLPTIDGPYVDGVSLTYGNPRQHIWTFAVEIDEGIGVPSHFCPCTMSHFSQDRSRIPTYVGNDYFCETGVPPGQHWSHRAFYPDDPLWDGQGCGPNSTCCIFNNPPWFCKQLPQSTNADLEIRLCNVDGAAVENTLIELIEIYVK